ncbi:MAG TPA: amidohydrolase/deacetylase family metallohydrolase [Stellaceae bacterium]|jgi:dihydroorotase|nr:amidohydrolase/deacetylase family metallohydrolase [Stellaceae bacterium]
MLNLILKGGRVVDPAHGRNEITDIGFGDGRVETIGTGLPLRAEQTIDVSNMLVAPGLIDLHTHVYWGGTSMGVDAATVARRSGTTTFVDAGSAGPGNFHGFRRHVIEPSPLRILPYLNVSFPGIFAFSPAVMVGEAADLRLIDPRECVRVINEHRDLIVGVKVRVGRGAGGASGAAPLDIAIEVAEEVGLPVMAHLDNPPPSRLEVLSRLRPGDVITHCFRPFPNAPVWPDGRVRDEVLAARDRGVIFDIGHGGGSFGFRTAELMLEAGFLPDVISSDVHAMSINGPAFDQLVTMSKFLALGVDLTTVIGASTAAPANIVGRRDLGHLAVGAVGDATILQVVEGEFDYRDVLGETRRGRHRLVVRAMVVGGKLWPGAPQA